MKKLYVTLLVLVSTMIIFSFNAQADYSQGELYYTISDGSITITSYWGTDAMVTVPSQIGPYPVNSIGEGAFVGTYATKVLLPSTITYIHPSAFDEGVEIVYDYDKTKVYVASVGGKKYETLKEALNQVPGNGTQTTVTILRTFSFESKDPCVISEGQNVLLDLKNCKITMKDTSLSNTKNCMFRVNGKLTVTASETGELDYTRDDENIQAPHGFFENHGTLVIQAGTFQSASSGKIYGIYDENDLQDTSVTIKNGTFRILSGDGNIYVKVHDTSYRNNINIANGKFTTGNVNSNGNITVDGSDGNDRATTNIQIFGGTFSTAQRLISLLSVSRNAVIRIIDGTYNGEIYVSADSVLDIPPVLVEEGAFNLSVKDLREDKTILPLQITGGVFTEQDTPENYHIGTIQTVLSDRSNKDVYPFLVVNKTPSGYWNTTNLNIQSELRLQVYAKTSEAMGEGLYVKVYMPDGKTQIITDYTETAYGYCFAFPVNPQYMYFNYRIDLMMPQGYLDTMISYSVRDYCNTMAASSNDAKLLNLLAGMLNYGANAQLYKKEAMTDLANNPLWVASYTQEFVPVTNNMSYTGGEGKAGFNIANLDLTDVINVSFYGVTDGDGFKVNLYRTKPGKSPELVKTETIIGEDFTIRSDAILFNEMDDMYTAVLLQGTVEVMTLNYDVQSYVYSFQNSSKDTVFRDLVRAMWNYGLAAKAYSAK